MTAVDEKPFKLTLDKQATYRIIVPGEVQKFQLGVGDFTVDLKEIGPDNQAVTVMTCVFDQAGLYGFIRRLYAMGLPLIEVVCRDYILSDPINHIIKGK